MRRWAVILGKGVQRGNLGALAEVMSGQALSATRSIFQIDLGNEWPGPQPFTPVRVHTTGATATVDFCWQIKGWSLDPKTHAPISARREIAPAQFVLKKTHGVWTITTAQGGSFDCSSVRVKGVAW